MENEKASHAPGVVSQNSPKVFFAVITAVVVLSAITFGAYKYSQSKSGTIVLPGGVTYLGPTPDTKDVAGAQAVVRFTADPKTPWIPFVSKLYPYTFSYPNTLNLLVFQNDPTDSIAINWGAGAPQEKIMFRVEDVHLSDKMKSYADGPKRVYVENWWQQYDGLKNLASISEFTNTRGMKGWKVKYTNTANQTPTSHVFFEVPDNDVVVMFANGILEPEVYDRIIDTFEWKETTPQPTRTPTTQPTSAPSPSPTDGSTSGQGAQGAGGQ